MKRLVWLTDIHLDLLLDQQRRTFYQQVAQAQADAILIGGDISEAPRLATQLVELDEALSPPIYFVLGNHDYFRGSIGETRREVATLCQPRPNLVWLTTADPVSLSPDTALIGHDGWADGRLGDYERSLVIMLDYSLIGEFAGRTKLDRWHLLKDLADEAARQTREKLLAALAQHPRVFLLTHVPPFREACWYDGQISNDQWLPHFTSHAMGQMLLDVMLAHSHHHLTVLCGHTHGRGRAQPAPNILVLTGGAQYGHPEIQQIFQID